MPMWNADQGAWETSSFRTAGLTVAELQELGSQFVQKPLRPVYGFTFLAASHIRANRLDVVPAEPPARHCVIVNWPGEKPDQMIRAKELARELVATTYQN